MPKITIDAKDYELDTLSDTIKAQLNSIRFIDLELARLQAQASVLQTARIAYSKVLKEELERTADGDTIKFS